MRFYHKKLWLIIIISYYLPKKLKLQIINFLPHFIYVFCIKKVEETINLNRRASKRKLVCVLQSIIFSFFLFSNCNEWCIHLTKQNVILAGWSYFMCPWTKNGPTGHLYGYIRVFFCPKELQKLSLQLCFGAKGRTASVKTWVMFKTAAHSREKTISGSLVPGDWPHVQMTDHSTMV